MPFDIEAGQQSVSRQVGQARPANTAAVSVYTPADGMTTDIVTLVICNSSASAAAYRVFHDADGTTYDESTALFYDVTIPAKTTDIHDMQVFMADSGGNLAVRTDTASALTFTVYGHETQVRAR